MVTIKKASELTGVPEHTLRAWERRYSLLAPSRTASGYRNYDDETLARVTAMHELVQAGWAPRAAAVEVAHHPRIDGAGVDPHAELLSAAAALDASAVAQVIEDRFAHSGFEMVVDRWLMPALHRIGLEWAEGTVSVAAEHLVSNVVMRRLSTFYEAVGRGQSGRPVLIGAPPGVDHQIGLMAFAVAARRAGLPTIYLGAQVPLPAWREAATKSGAWVAVTTVPRSRDVARARRVVECLGEEHLPVWVGGKYQHLVAEPSLRLGHSIATAAATLAARAAAPEPIDGAGLNGAGLDGAGLDGSGLDGAGRVDGADPADG
ncbi:MAG TPA: MerR family transcriptional regulator [Propionicimonas sp.]|nr:MerR family transcriptional regulator [Propionicimonas sp.]